MAIEIPIECLSGETFGCTYPSALNYNPFATFDDGSCNFNSIIEANSFEVNIFASHQQTCDNSGTPDRTAAFFLHIPQIIPNYTPTSNFQMFILLYAYNYEYNKLGIPSGVDTACGGGGGVRYTNESITVLGDSDRYANRKQVIYIDSLLPSYSNTFSVYEDESDFNFSTSIPVQIEIYSDGVKYTGSGNVPMNTFSGAVSDLFTITVS
jgi:hypothetical protein